jgi:hypothetical protein
MTEVGRGWLLSSPVERRIGIVDVGSTFFECIYGIVPDELAKDMFDYSYDLHNGSLVLVFTERKTQQTLYYLYSCSLW